MGGESGGSRRRVQGRRLAVIVCASGTSDAPLDMRMTWPAARLPATPQPRRPHRRPPWLRRQRIRARSLTRCTCSGWGPSRARRPAACPTSCAKRRCTCSHCCSSRWAQLRPRRGVRAIVCAFHPTPPAALLLPAPLPCVHAAAAPAVPPLPQTASTGAPGRCCTVSSSVDADDAPPFPCALGAACSWQLPPPGASCPWTCPSPGLLRRPSRPAACQALRSRVRRRAPLYCCDETPGPTRAAPHPTPPSPRLAPCCGRV